jgi:serine phosphatase RsbU (regulator of sigma subunit)
VTAIFLRLDPAGSELEFVNAGHNPAILLTPSASSSGYAASTIGASGTPLGLIPGMRYATERVSFPPGSRLLLYTDGLTEVFREDDEEFGLERLCDAFRAHPSDDAETSLDNLWEILDSFTGGAHQQDDMTAIALYRLGTSRSSTAVTGSSKETA